MGLDVYVLFPGKDVVRQRRGFPLPAPGERPCTTITGYARDFRKRRKKVRWIGKSSEYSDWCAVVHRLPVTFLPALMLPPFCTLGVKTFCDESLSPPPFSQSLFPVLAAGTAAGVARTGAHNRKRPATPTGYRDQLYFG